MKILGIRFARLGDIVLLLPSFSLLKAIIPDAHLTLLTGLPCEPIGSMCSAIDDVIAVDRIAMRDGSKRSAVAAMFQMIQSIRRREFDLVIDYHSFRETNLITWLSGAPSRVGLKRADGPYLRYCFNNPPIIEDKNLHVAEMFYTMTRQLTSGHHRSETQIPSSFTARHYNLTIPTELKAWARTVVPAGPRVGLYIDAPVAERIWPPEHFAKLADFAVEQFGASVIVMAGSNSEALIPRVEKAIRYPQRTSMIANITIPQLAALIESTSLFVSNDTGPMHLGPAVGVPTLGLFSVGYPEHFRPTGPGDQFLRGNPIEKIGAEDVKDLMKQMWTRADPDSRHLS